MFDSKKNRKLTEIEEAIIDRLHFFTALKTSSGTPWNREAVVQLSDALKNVTIVKLMNQKERDEEASSPFAKCNINMI